MDRYANLATFLFMTEILSIFTLVISELDTNSEVLLLKYTCSVRDAGYIKKMNEWIPTI